MILGGYERFSAEYPFLRTQKIMYTSLVSCAPSNYTRIKNSIIIHDVIIITGASKSSLLPQ